MNITKLKPNQIFVFGSNTAGRHGKGAAKQAMNWGAKYGQGEGLQGQTYGIPTLDGRFRKLPLLDIFRSVKMFLNTAQTHPELEFLVTDVGCGLAGFSPKEIAPMFKDALELPNVVLHPNLLKELEK